MKRCLSCKQPAAWIRHTQFAGDHPFCDEHARAEANFGVNDSYQDWEQIITPGKPAAYVEKKP